MRRTRVIPCLLLRRRGFYKTTKFKDPVYLGDPINIVRIFNDKEVDEIVVLDIGATPSRSAPQLDFLGEFASECFMPLAYGGGIRKMEEIRAAFQIGVEKCIVNSAFHDSASLVRQAATEWGSQSIVVSIDVKKRMLGGYEVYTEGGAKKTGRTPVEVAVAAEKAGAGEILLQSIDRDGTMKGYDLALIKSVCDAVSIPVVAAGGAGSVRDLADAAASGAAAVSAGAYFVFTGPHRAVLINVPRPPDLDAALP